MIIEPDDRRAFLLGAVAAFDACPEKPVNQSYLNRMVVLYGSARMFDPAIGVAFSKEQLQRYRLQQYAFDVPARRVTFT